MTAIYFRGGDLDGQARTDIPVDPDTGSLRFDGIHMPPRGTYDRTEETVDVDGVNHEVWQLRTT